MNCKIVEKENKKYIEINEPFTCEADVSEIIGVCMSKDSYILLLREKVFNEDFINLKTGLAGMVLQKFINYHIKVSAVLEDSDKIQGRFKELLSELKKSTDFRVFNDVQDAENWILATLAKA